MTWTRLSDSFYDDPTLLAASRDARLLHVEALTWCNRYGTDGAIPTAALSRITDSPDPMQSVKELIDVGLWEETPTGWQVVGWAKEQLLAEEVEKTRSLAQVRQRRKRRHSNGVHDQCDPKYCRAAAALLRDSPRDSPRDDPPTRPSRPDPTEREGKGRRGGVSRSLAEGSLRLAAEGVRESLMPGGSVRIRFPAPGEWWMTALLADAPNDPTDVDITISPARDEHVKIAVGFDIDRDYDGQPVETPTTKAAVELLRRLGVELLRDVDTVQKAHNCPRTASSTEDCHLTDHTDDGEPSLMFAIPTNRLATWLDLIAYELVSLNPRRSP